MFAGIEAMKYVKNEWRVSRGSFYASKRFSVSKRIFFLPMNPGYGVSFRIILGISYDSQS